MGMILTIVLLLFSFQGQDMMEWSAERPLIWTDFQGVPGKNSTFSAQTDWSIGYNSSMKGDSLFFEIRCYFTPSTSWVKKEKATDFLLAHEQKHFDIAQLFTRRMRRAFAAHHWKKEALDKDPDKLYSKYFKECAEMQDRYDRETDHSRNKEQQLQWAKRVSRMLDDLQAWQSPGLGVKISP